MEYPGRATYPSLLLAQGEIGMEIGGQGRPGVEELRARPEHPIDDLVPGACGCGAGHEAVRMSWPPVPPGEAQPLRPRAASTHASRERMMRLFDRPIHPLTASCDRKRVGPGGGARAAVLAPR